jgi:hypothetical protein
MPKHREWYISIVCICCDWRVSILTYTLTGKKNGTLISQQQIIPIIPILMYFDQEAMIANITLSISLGYFISNFAYS